MLYLQWGQNRETGLSHDELYRGDTPDFVIGENTKVADVEPGKYPTTIRYEDRGLQPDTVYYYRVVAVGRDGSKGEPSERCEGVTRERVKDKTTMKN